MGLEQIISSIETIGEKVKLINQEIDNLKQDFKDYQKEHRDAILLRVDRLQQLQLQQEQNNKLILDLIFQKNIS